MEVDEAKALSLNVPVADVSEFASHDGALYVNDFNFNSRTYRVQLQADAPYRAPPDDFGQVYVRSSTGGHDSDLGVDHGQIHRGSRAVGALQRFSSPPRYWATPPSISSGDAIQIVEDVAQATLPTGYELAWTGQAFQERHRHHLRRGLRLRHRHGVPDPGGAVREVVLPLAVILAVPFALCGALAAVLIRGMPNDIYFQIGLVVLIGLASKNAILIVEFAAQKQAEGLGILEAALKAPACGCDPSS